MRIILLLLLALLPIRGYAQKQGQELIDSLLKELPKLKEDTNKVNLLDGISEAYSGINPDESIKYEQESLDLSKKLGWKVWAGDAYITLGLKYKDKADYLKALQCFTSGLRIFEEIGQKRGIGASMCNIGTIYLEQGDYTKAIEYFFKALAIDEEIGEKQYIGVVTSNLGIIYKEQGDYPKALEYYSKGLKIFEELGRKEAAATATYNIGTVYKMQKNYPMALEYFLKAQKILEETGNEGGFSAQVIGNSGHVYALEGNNLTAMTYALQAYQRAEKIGAKRPAAFALWVLGEVYFSLSADTVKYKNRSGIFPQQALHDNVHLLDIPAGRQVRLNMAISYYLRALDSSKNIGTQDIVLKCYESLVKAYKHAGNYELALESYQNYTKLKDSLFSKENEKKIVRNQMQYEFDKKEAIAQAELLRQKRQKQLYLGGGALMLAIASVAVFALLATRQAKREAELQQSRAEQSERFKQQFLANMSHEIRTPMNAVLGMTNLIIDNPQSPKINKYLTAIKKSSENLLVIINDILDLSKLQAGKMELEHIPFRLSEQIGQVYNTMQFKAEEKGLILETIIANDIPDVLVGDPSRLNQVLINLSANAIKFTDKGKVSIVVEHANGLTPALSKGEGAPTQVAIHFKVIDQGIGIPADKVGRLFESFQQVDASTSRKYGGTGLGLSISKTLVELQGGKMEVKSEEGKGSEFSFIITYTRATEEEIAELVMETKADNTSLTGIKILVAEDNEYNQIVIKDTLENLIKGVKVEIAENGKIAIDKLIAGDYDVILMDAQMPEMSGLEASEYIRKNLIGKKSETPIIALTASVLNTDINKCIDAGMNDYVPKPFTRAQLLNTLAKYYKNAIPASEADIPTLIQVTPIVENTASGITDLTFLRDFCENDDSKMRKYIDIYLKVTPGNLEKIKKALEENNYKLLATTVHAMKAHLNYMGMKQTRELADRIETSANEQSDLDRLPELIVQLERDWEQSRDELS